MGAAYAFNQGLKAIWQNKRIWFFFYGLNLLFAFFVDFPLRRLVFHYFGHSKSLEILLTRFDFMALTNFLRDSSSGISVLSAFFLLLVFVYWLLLYFFAGGSYYVYLFPKRDRSFPAFFQMSAFYFGSMLRLLLFFLLFGIGLLFLHLLLLQGLGMLKSHISNEITSSLLRVGFLSIMAVVFMFFKMLFDYARATVVLLNERSALVALGKSIGFVLKHFFSAIGLFYLILLSGFFLFLVYVPLKLHVSDLGTDSVLFIFAIQQIFILLQTAVRLQFYAAQGIYLKTELLALDY